MVVCFGISHKEVGYTKRDSCATGRNPPSKRCIQLLANRLLASPRKSLCVLSQETRLSRSMCQRAAKKAGLHAHRFRVVQELKQLDYDKRMTYCRWFQTFIDENPGILDYTRFSDDAWFHLSCYVNSQNARGEANNQFATSYTVFSDISGLPRPCRSNNVLVSSFSTKS
jgi:hypothetical protein